jgi:hypothetical protein
MFLKEEAGQSGRLDIPPILTPRMRSQVTQESVCSEEKERNNTGNHKRGSRMAEPTEELRQQKAANSSKSISGFWKGEGKLEMPSQGKINGCGDRLAIQAARSAHHSYKF